MISLSGVSKRYPGGKDALLGVSLAIESGAFALVAGASGAGKSTLLKLIATIERPTSGTVVLNGQNMAALRRSPLPYALLFACLAMLNTAVAELSKTYGTVFQFQFLAPTDAIAVTAFSGLIGWLGAYLSVSKYLR